MAFFIQPIKKRIGLKKKCSINVTSDDALIIKREERRKSEYCKQENISPRLIF